MMKTSDEKKFAIVPKNNEEYRKVLHSLKVCSCFANIKVDKIKRISNQGIDFDNVSSNKLILESWVITSPTHNPVLEQIMTEGVMKLPPENYFKFSVGTIFNSVKDFDEDQEYSLVLCKIAVGRAMTFKASEDFPKSKAELPRNYDSVYLMPNDQKEDSGYEKLLYRHDYLIYNHQQVLPCYLVTCKFKLEMEIGKENCEKCSSPATVYCKEDNAYLCQDCDDLIHNSNEEFVNILGKHHRVSITEKPPSFDKCKDHKYNIEFFCDTCQQPLCVYCKMLGNHASGEYSNHAIVPIADAYETAKYDAHNEDPILRKKKAQMQALKKNTQKKILEVRNNGKEVEEKIYKVLKTVLAELTEELEKRVKLLLSDKHEIQRQYEEIIHAEIFFREQLPHLSGIEFINLWINHKIHKKQLLKTHINITEMPPDIQLKGSLSLDEEKDIKSQQVDLAVEKPKSLDTEERKEDYSSPFRKAIFAKKSIPTKEGGRTASKLFSDSISNAGGNIPTPMRLVDKDIADQNRDRLGESGAIRAANKMTADVEKIIAVLDERMRDTCYKGTVTIESMKRSFYGRFSDNFKKLRKTVDPEKLNNVLNNCFRNSSILSPSEGVVLYFNLPLTETWLPKPRKIFPDESNPDSFSISNLLTLFEMSKNNSPNIILVNNESGDEKFGGYASEAWSTTKEKCGNQQCFLFNITKNIRFDAMKGKGFYQFCPNLNCIKFGDKDLVFDEDFSKCSSEVESYFSGGSSIYRSKDSSKGEEKSYKVDTILAGKRVFNPKLIEVWCLNQ